MTGQKTLEQIRAELEAAFGRNPPGDGRVAEAIRQLLSSWPRAGKGTDPAAENNSSGADAATPNEPATPGR